MFCKKKKKMIPLIGVSGVFRVRFCLIRVRRNEPPVLNCIIRYKIDYSTTRFAWINFFLSKNLTESPRRVAFQKTVSSGIRDNWRDKIGPENELT